jgi:hypothetical protein
MGAAHGWEERTLSLLRRRDVLNFLAQRTLAALHEHTKNGWCSEQLVTLDPRCFERAPVHVRRRVKVELQALRSYPE